MKKLFFIIMFILGINLQSDSQVLPLWQVSFNDSIPETNYSDKSKLDNEGNIIIMADGTNSSGSNVDYVIIKYNPNGVKLWNRRYNGAGNNIDYPTDMVIDKNNNIYITGRSWGGASKNDYLTLKYSPDGELLWERRFNWLVSKNDEAYSIAIDSNNNVYVTGLATAAYNGNELYDMVTVKYNSTGDQKWVRSFIGYGDHTDWGYTVVCDLDGNIYVSGFTRSLKNGHDIITVKYDSLGNEIWQRRFYNKGDDFIRPLISKTDANNNLVIASYSKSDSTYIDYLTYKYDSSGNVLWSHIYDRGVHNTDWIKDVIIDRENNIIISGSSWGSGSSYDFLTIKYSPTGNELWQSFVNDSNILTNDDVRKISIDSEQNLYVFGSCNTDYSVVCIYNKIGNVINKFRNMIIENAISINIDEKGNIILVGIRGSKTITAKYPNIITLVNQNDLKSQQRYVLNQNYPNPFNPITSFEFWISKRGYITLEVYDVLGNKIKTLVNQEKAVGNYEVEFDGRILASGIYFYSLTIDHNLVETKKMLLLK